MDQYMEENYLSTYFLESYAEIELMIDELNISFMESGGKSTDTISDEKCEGKIRKILSKIESLAR